MMFLFIGTFGRTGDAHFRERKKQNQREGVMVRECTNVIM